MAGYYACGAFIQKGLSIQESKQEVTKIISLVKNGGKSNKVYPVTKDAGRFLGT